MKKINSGIYIFLLALLVFTFACGEKDLELQPTTESSATFYEQQENVETALWMCYNALLTRTGPWGNTLIQWGSFSSDDAYTGGADANDQKTFQSIEDYTLTPEDPSANLGQMWRINFQGIYACNLVIDNVKPDKDFNKQAIAEAKFLKAFYYFQLARMFGGLPIIRATPAPEDLLPRATQSETYTYIEELLNEAISSGAMQQRVGKKDPENGRATLASAQGLLGKVYLYNGKYAEAKAILLTLATNPNYELLRDFSALFLPYNKHTVESVFEINYSSVAGAGNEAFGNGEIQLFGPRNVSLAPYSDTIAAGWGFNKPTPNLVAAFINANDQVRLHATSITSDSLNALYKIFYTKTKPASSFVPYEMVIHPSVENDPISYWDKKHMPNPKFQGTSWTNFRYNVLALRLADIFLLLAEASNRTGDDATAITYVNKVRARVGLPGISSSGAALLNDIKLERRLELALEGDRYFDLVRWGDAATVLGPLGYTSGTPGVKTNGLFPIPIAELNRTDWEQNPGY